MLSDILVSIKRWIKDGIVTSPICPPSRQQTAVLPKKGMLVYYMDCYSFYSRKELEDKAKYCLVLDAIVDDYGKCKFQYLDGEKTKWTDWMDTRRFNDDWEIFNPWV